MTSNSEHTAFRSRPRISRERFVHEMRMIQSPWANKAEALYDLIKLNNHDPAVWLGIGIREHRLLTDPDAVALKLQTNSWTNARSVRVHDMAHEMVTTSDLRKAGITNRQGPYVRYRSVEDSLIDGMRRVDDPSYVYRQRHAVTLGQVLRIWTESDAERYIASVVSNLNRWSEGEFGLTWWDDPEFEFIPGRHGEYGYPAGSWERGREVDMIIMHITAGTDSLAWLVGPNGSSAHYLTYRDGRPRAQIIPEAWAAWTAGNREYNQRSINIEHEKLRLADPWSPEEYQQLAWLAARIIRRNPGIKVDRQHIIGHSEVPDPIHPGRFGGAGNHVDPGPHFDWPRFMALIAEELDSDVQQPEPGDPNVRFFEATGKHIVNQDGVNMLDYWRSVGGLEVCGYPLSGMALDDDGIYRQLCENVLLECWPDGFGHHQGPHYRFGGLGQRFARLG